MNNYQCAAYIIEEWRRFRHPSEMQLRLMYAGRRLSRQDIMFVIKSWVESQTENNDYHASNKEPRR